MLRRRRASAGRLPEAARSAWYRFGIKIERRELRRCQTPGNRSARKLGSSVDREDGVQSVVRSDGRACEKRKNSFQVRSTASTAKPRPLQASPALHAIEEGFQPRSHGSKLEAVRFYPTHRCKGAGTARAGATQQINATAFSAKDEYCTRPAVGILEPRLERVLAAQRGPFGRKHVGEDSARVGPRNTWRSGRGAAAARLNVAWEARLGGDFVQGIARRLQVSATAPGPRSVAV